MCFRLKHFPAHHNDRTPLPPAVISEFKVPLAGSNRPPSWILLKSKMTSRHVADCPCLPLCQIWWQFSNGGWVIAIFLFSKWRPAAILDFDVAQKWHPGTLRAVHGHQHTKFGEDISNSGWVMDIFLFFKMAAAAILDFVGFYFRPPTKSNWWPEAMFKILCRSNLYFERYCDFNFRKFGLKCLFGPKNWVLWEFHP